MTTNAQGISNIAVCIFSVIPHILSEGMGLNMKRNVLLKGNLTPKKKCR